MSECLTPRLNGYIPHAPTVKQTAFLLLPHREVLFGGAAGGGKSDALLMAALQYVDQPGYAAIIFRTTHSALTLPDGLIPRSHEWLAGTDATWNEQKKTWSFPSGATLTFGYLENENDKFRYASSAYQFIGFEELTEFKREADYRFLFSRLRRRSNQGKIPLRMRATTNPIGPGYAWVKLRFVDSLNTAKRLYLPSTLDDNPHLDKEAYEESLEELPADVREKLRHGSWKAVATGEYFKKEDFRLIDPGDVPELVKVVRMWDLAGTKPTPQNPDPDWTAGVLIGECVDGDIYICHAEHLRDEGDVVQAAVERMSKIDGRKTYIRMEREGGQAGKDQIRYYTKILKGHDFDGIVPTGNKVVRAGPLASQVRRGNVYVACSGPWVSTFLDEAEGFPYAGHDDLIDAAAHGYNFLIDARPKTRKRQYGPRIT